MSFPKNFVWGVAAAAYQIEGAWNKDGRKPSIWDVHARTPGKTFEGHNGDTACDHYRLYREDVALMKKLGAGAYRLSISWPRVLPDGTGGANKKGLAFYDRLIDELLKAGVAPWVTLYHWDLPQALQKRGGFLKRDFADWFADYAALMAKHLGDRVNRWMTFNEPPCIVGLGHQDGVFAPGLKLPFGDCLQAAHHLLLAHGKGVQALRAGCRGKIKISLAHTSRERIPATKSAKDIEAARRDYFACETRNMWNLAWWADPILFGRYPEDGLRNFKKDLPKIRPGDMELIAQKIDFLAYNCYSGNRVKADKKGEAVKLAEKPGNPRGTLPWLAVMEDAAYWAARFQTERYKLPIVFSENGFCNTDFVHLDGKVHDPQRIDFLARYLGAIGRAAKEGIPVAGYFYWSVMDNFEWCEGYKDRFGLVHVDYGTQKRTPKDSWHWYKKVIAANGRNISQIPGPF